MMRMVQDGVLVKEDAGQDADIKQQGKIFVVQRMRDKEKEGARFGTVVKVGPGLITKKGALVPVAVKPGQRVMYGQYAGSDVSCGGDEKLLVINERAIWAVVEN